MSNYYYTFGCSPGFPYRDGWVIVKAASWEEAHQKFRDRFPDRHEDTLNCSFFYDAEKWTRSTGGPGGSSTKSLSRG